MESLAPPRVPRLSGVVLLDQIRVMNEELGEDVCMRARKTLSPEVNGELDALIPISWIDVGVAMDLKNAVAHEVGRDSIEFQRWIVRTALGRTIHKFWRVFLSNIWDSALVKRVPIIYSRSFDRGELALVDMENGLAELVLSGWRDMPEYDAIGLATGIESVLEYSGRVHARTKIGRRDTFVTFRATWNKR